MQEAAQSVSQYLMGFTSALKDEGLVISPSHTSTYLLGTKVIRFDNIRELYWAGRGILVSSPDNIPVYDQVFNRYFRLQGNAVLGLGAADSASSDDDEESSTLDTAGGKDDEQESPAEIEVSVRKASGQEALNTQTLGLPNADESDCIRQIIATLSKHQPTRRSRRYRSSKKGDAVDLRNSMARLPRTDGELVRLLRKQKIPKKRQVLVLVDISGSVAMHLRANMYFCYALTQAFSGCESFCIGTRLTRISSFLRTKNIGSAMDKVSDNVLDWNGGTRLGEGVGQFLIQAGRMNCLRDSAVFIISDGLERGDPVKLIEEVSRVKRLCKQLFWLSPLASSRDFVPATRAMAAIDRIVDGIFPAAGMPDLYRSLSTILSKSQ